MNGEPWLDCQWNIVFEFFHNGFVSCSFKVMSSLSEGS